jgi:hypothetical protein
MQWSCQEIEGSIALGSTQMDADKENLFLIRQATEKACNAMPELFVEVHCQSVKSGVGRTRRLDEPGLPPKDESPCPSPRPRPP